MSRSSVPLSKHTWMRVSVATMSLSVFSPNGHCLNASIRTYFAFTHHRASDSLLLYFVCWRNGISKSGMCALGTRVGCLPDRIPTVIATYPSLYLIITNYGQLINPYLSYHNEQRVCQASTHLTSEKRTHSMTRFHNLAES